MTQKSNEYPPPLNVGLTYNLKRENSSEMEAEYDSIETITAIQNALTKQGHRVTLLEANRGLLNNLLESNIDIVFNIAEGTSGRSREAQVPALLSLYGYQFTGSDATTLCICLDKSLTKRVLMSQKIKTPQFQLIGDRNYVLNPKLKFPVIVKPNAEGSSKGITSISIVQDPDELRTTLVGLLGTYRQPMLVEEYISGREITVGVLGNGADTRVLRPMEIVFKEKDIAYNIYDYTVKQDYIEKIQYVCPAPVSVKIEKKIVDTAKKIYDILDCKDYARIDFRLFEEQLYFIEINPLAGLAPGYSDLPMLAKANGIEYDELINNILTSAIKRYAVDEED